MSRSPLLILLAVLASFLFTSTAHAVYDVQTGRFMQADPNGLGQPLITDAGWFGGRAPMLAVRGVNIRQHYGDGMNHFEYLRSNPVNNRNPLGLMTTMDLGMTGGIPGMLAGLLNGAASVGTSISGLMTSGGIWAINTTASGALVVGYNFDNIMMMTSHMDANGGDYWDDLVNFFNGAPDPRDLFTPAGRELTMHAIQRMGERGISSAEIDRVIDAGKRITQSDGTLNIYLRAKDITVIFDQAANRVVTVFPGTSPPQ